MEAAVLEGTATYSSLEVCALAGVTYRQLDHWVRAGHVPGMTERDVAPGSGRQRRFSQVQLDAIKDLKRAMELKNAPVQDVVEYMRTCVVPQN